MRIKSAVRSSHCNRGSLESHSALLDLIERSDGELQKVVPGFKRANSSKFRLLREPKLRQCIRGIGQVDDAFSPDFVLLHFHGAKTLLYIIEVKSCANSDKVYYARERLESDLKIARDYVFNCHEDLVASLGKYGIPKGVVEKASPCFRGLYRRGKHLEAYFPEFSC